MRIKKNPLQDINFYYSGVDITYDNQTSNDHGERCKDDYCRCSTIENQRVTNVDMLQVVEKIVEPPAARRGLDIEKYAIDKYCIDRILTSYKVFDPNNWNIKVCPGYYGEEINCVSINTEVATKVDQEITRITSLPSINDKVREILILEYGYLLDILKTCQFRVDSVDKANIIFPRKEYYTKLDKASVDRYIDYTLPRGIVIFSAANNSWRVIDGYHRISAAKPGKVEVIIGEVQL